MIKTIFQAKIINPYRASGKFYDKKRKHTGEDYVFNYELFPSPITGKVLKIAKQAQMGNTAYIEDAWGSIHVMSHFKSFDVREGQKIKRGDIVGVTGNTGTASTGPHLHYEIITKELRNPKEDYHLVRKLFNFVGYNTAPLKYLMDLYKYYGVDWKTGKQSGGWITTNTKKVTKLLFPNWISNGKK